jgi:hypothetical protein
MTFGLDAKQITSKTQARKRQYTKVLPLKSEKEFDFGQGYQWGTKYVIHFRIRQCPN